MKNKILMFVHNLTGGGAERVAALWVNGFKERGYDIEVVLSDTSSPVTYKIPDDVPIHSVDVHCTNRIIRSVLLRTVQVFKIRKILKKTNPDIVITVLPGWLPFLRMASVGINYKLVSTDHNSYERPPEEPMPRKQYREKFCYQKKADVVTILTEADRKYINNRLGNIRVLPNPLAFKPLDVVPPKKKIILAAGRLDADYNKGFDVLIKAFAIVCKHTEWQLQIAGTGSPEAMKKYVTLSEEMGVADKVVLLGFTNNIIDYYRDAAVFVLSSRYEGFGMVLIEAMSQGCACVACDYKGRQSEIITTESEGVIVEPDNINSLANGIKKLITDDTYRSIVQMNAIKRASFYKLDNIMNRWESILSSLF